MEVYDKVEILEGIQKKDKEKAERKSKEGGTWCARCGNNTFVGRYPFWHRFSRSLCSTCGLQYTEFLKQLGAFSTPNSRVFMNIDWR